MRAQWTRLTPILALTSVSALQAQTGNALFAPTNPFADAPLYIPSQREKTLKTFSTRAGDSATPPSRIGGPMAATISLQRLKASGPIDELPEATPSLEFDSRISYSVFDSPNQDFFENLQFLCHLKASIEAPGLGLLQMDIQDRWNVARELMEQRSPSHIPELQRLFWQWKAPDQPITTTLGRQRLTLDGNRSYGSVSWQRDMQVFDGLRVDLGSASDAGKWTLGAFIDQYLATPFFAGPKADDAASPLFLLGYSIEHATLGKWDLYSLANEENPENTLVGVHWRENPGNEPHRPIHAIDFTIAPAAADTSSESIPWHLSLHRQMDDWTWHLGAEHIGDGVDSRRISATPGTFRYLPDPPDTELLNVFIGFDCLINPTTLATFTYQQLWEEDSGQPAASIYEAALRHQISPEAALLGGAGIGQDQLSGETFLRTGFQLTAAF